LLGSVGFTETGSAAAEEDTGVEDGADGEDTEDAGREEESSSGSDDEASEDGCREETLGIAFTRPVFRSKPGVISTGIHSSWNGS